MDLIYNLVLVLHLLGWAIVLGGALTNLRSPRIAPGMLHGILTAIFAGVIMVGLVESGVVGGEPSMAKIGVKLIIALAVLGLILVGGNDKTKATRGLLGAIAGLTALNVAIAVLW